MLVRWTTSRCADCDTRESDESEMMWSQIPDKVLHYEEKQVNIITHIQLQLLAKKFFFWELSENKRIIYFLALGNLQVVKELESQEWELKWTENIHVNKIHMYVQLFWPKYFIMHWEYLSTWINFSTLTVCSLKKKKKAWWTSTHLLSWCTTTNKMEVEWNRQNKCLIHQLNKLFWLPNNQRNSTNNGNSMNFAFYNLGLSFV